MANLTKKEKLLKRFRELARKGIEKRAQEDTVLINQFQEIVGDINEKYNILLQNGAKNNDNMLMMHGLSLLIPSPQHLNEWIEILRWTIESANKGETLADGEKERLYTELESLEKIRTRLSNFFQKAKTQSQFGFMVNKDTNMRDKIYVSPF